MKTQQKAFVPIAFTLAALALNVALTPSVHADGFYFDYTWMNYERAGHTATRLASSSNQLLVAGGIDYSGNAIDIAEIYTLTDGSPQAGYAAGSWSYTGSMNTPRYFHSALSLPNGKILVAGGNDGAGDALVSAELYDPSNGTWSYTGSMNVARQQHTATLLPNGLVLVAGGFDVNGNAVTNAELYNPATGTWTNTGSMHYARCGHTATLLPNGKVLVAGGSTSGMGNSWCMGDTWWPAIFPPVGGSFASAELYDPATGTWMNTGSMFDARAYHTATLLPSSQVLVAGGLDNSGNAMASAELYDPTVGTWASTTALNTACFGHTATLLPAGQVVVAGGKDSWGTGIADCELYYPLTATWTNTAQSLQSGRGWGTASLLYDGYTCWVVVAGGGDWCSLQDVDVYDCLNGNNNNVSAGNSCAATDWMNAARSFQTAALLTNGQVLVVGGIASTTLASAELYNPLTRMWTNTGSMNAVRYGHSMALLTNGQVLVVGGADAALNGAGYLNSAELYNPGTGTWTNTGSMNDIRVEPTLTVLTNGLVLVAGGQLSNGGPPTSSAELYNPATRTWTNTGSMHDARYVHTATLLYNGQVLVAGGLDTSLAPLASAELYNPVTGMWTNTGSMHDARYFYTATPVPSWTDSSSPYGKVLVAGGYGNSGVLASAELYNPVTHTWTNTASMTHARAAHTATSGPAYGAVFVTGGDGGSGILDSTEVYDVFGQNWGLVGSMDVPRWFHTATPSAAGIVITGGSDDSNPSDAIPTAELFNGW